MLSSKLKTNYVCNIYRTKRGITPGGVYKMYYLVIFCSLIPNTVKKDLREYYKTKLSLTYLCLWPTDSPRLKRVIVTGGSVVVVAEKIRHGWLYWWPSNKSLSWNYHNLLQNTPWIFQQYNKMKANIYTSSKIF